MAFPLGDAIFSAILCPKSFLLLLSSMKVVKNYGEKLWYPLFFFFEINTIEILS